MISAINVFNSTLITGEPNGGDDPMCVEARLTGWNDNPCNKQFAVVCQQIEGISI